MAVFREEELAWERQLCRRFLTQPLVDGTAASRPSILKYRRDRAKLGSRDSNHPEFCAYRFLHQQIIGQGGMPWATRNMFRDAG